jgi:hypothetical protein
MTQYLDVATYASDTLRTVKTLETLSSSTGRLTSSTILISDALGKTADNLSKVISVQQNTIDILSKLLSLFACTSLFLLFVSFRRELWLVGRLFVGSLREYIQLIFSWDKEKKLDKIFFPFFWIVIGCLLTLLFTRLF